MKRWRMDRSKKSFIGALLGLAGASMFSVQEWSLTPTAIALILVGLWMAFSSGVAESFWTGLDEGDADETRSFQCSVCGLEGHEPGDSQCDGPHGGFVDPDCTQPCCAEANAKAVEVKS